MGKLFLLAFICLQALAVSADVVKGRVADADSGISYSYKMMGGQYLWDYRVYIFKFRKFFELLKLKKLRS